MPDLDYGLFDADNHYYESRDCFTRHLDPYLRDVLRENARRLISPDWSPADA